MHTRELPFSLPHHLCDSANLGRGRCGGCGGGGGHAGGGGGDGPLAAYIGSGGRRGGQCESGGAMERTACARLLLFVAASVVTVAAQTYVGDACKKKDGGAGVCRKISDCDEARAALLKGEPPVVCSYDGFTPIVCCPVATPSAPPPPADRITTRMCTKYGEAVYRYEQSFHIPPQKLKIDQCAIKGVPFIAGGEQASSNEFPHMALLGYGDTNQPEWGCGGSLVSERFVLTAAHCIYTSLGSPKVVRLGELNLKTTAETNKHKDFLVAQSIPHPDYKDGVYYNDLGLLRLDRDATFTASIRPACLQPVKDFTETDAIASGWGFTDWATPEITEHLMKVKLPIHKTEVCQSSYRTLSTTSRLRKGIQEESMVCAGTLQGGKDTCRGDSGGPLQLKMKNPYCMYSIVGITSFGKGNCGTSKSPAIYTRVSNFLPWIESVVWPN